MPRSIGHSIYNGHASKRPAEDTIFALWLKAHGISKNKAAKLIGCSGRMIELWCQGRCLPGLLYAMMIEKVTQGGVSMEMWAGTSIGKHTWNLMIKRAMPNT